MEGQIDAGRVAGRADGIRVFAAEARHVLDGDLDRRSERLRAPRVDDLDRARPPGAAACRRTSPPPSRRATSSSGRCVAERPMRWSAAAPPRATLRGARARGRDARRAWSPRRAWISSTMTVSTEARMARALRREQQIERLGRRDEDVRRRSRESARARTRACRRSGRPRRARGGRAGLPRGRGDPGERSAQVALDVDRQGLERRDVERRGSAAPSEARARTSAGRSRRGTPRASCRSRWARGAASMRPRRMGGQPLAWASVGAPKEARNHSATAGWNPARESRLTSPSYAAPRP